MIICLENANILKPLRFSLGEAAALINNDVENGFFIPGVASGYECSALSRYDTPTTRSLVGAQQPENLTTRQQENLTTAQRTTMTTKRTTTTLPIPTPYFSPSGVPAACTFHP
jgi:hypothetical protein